MRTVFVEGDLLSVRSSLAGVAAKKEKKVGGVCSAADGGGSLRRQRCNRCTATARSRCRRGVPSAARWRIPASQARQVAPQAAGLTVVCPSPAQLEGGQLVAVPARLVVRQKQHFTGVEGTGTAFSLLCPLLPSSSPARPHSPALKAGVALVLGVNGLVWVGRGQTQTPALDTKAAHEQVARVANALRVLARLNFAVTPARIHGVYQARAGLRVLAAAERGVPRLVTEQQACVLQQGLAACPAAHTMLHQAFLEAVLAKEVAARQ